MTKELSNINTKLEIISPDQSDSWQNDFTQDVTVHKKFLP
jgi:hypothetical protein